MHLVDFSLRQSAYVLCLFSEIPYCLCFSVTSLLSSLCDSGSINHHLFAFVLSLVVLSFQYIPGIIMVVLSMCLTDQLLNNSNVFYQIILIWLFVNFNNLTIYCFLLLDKAKPLVTSIQMYFTKCILIWLFVNFNNLTIYCFLLLDKAKPLVTSISVNSISIWLF